MSGRWQLIDRERGAVVVGDLELANSFWSRLWGLQFRATLPEGSGLLLTPCASVHTFWMRVAIDVIWLDAQGVVLGVRSGVRPWRIALAPPGTHAVLEVPAGSAAVAPGTCLTIQKDEGGRMKDEPRSVLLHPSSFLLHPSWVAAVLLLGLAFLLAAVPPLWHSDVWAHLKFGEWIVTHGALPEQEPFCPFAEPHAAGLNSYWLIQCLWYLTYHLGEILAGGDELQQTAGGVEMLRCGYGLATALRFGVLLLAFRRRTGALGPACAFLTVVLAASLGHIAVLRPQVAGEFFFACLLLALGRPVLSKRALVLVPLCLVAWANMHGLFPIGLVLLGGCLAGRVLEAIRPGGTWAPRQVLRDPQVRRLTLVLILSAGAVAVLTPQGIGVYANVLHMASHPNLKTMREWGPLSFTRDWGWHWHYLALWFLAAVVMLLSGRRPTPTQLLLLAGFAALPLLQQRMMVWWIMMAPWVTAAQWRSEDRGSKIEDRRSSAMASSDPRSSILDLRSSVLAALVGAFLLAVSPPVRWLTSGRPTPLQESVSAGTPWRVAAQLQSAGDGPVWLPRLAKGLHAGYPRGRFTGTVFASEVTGDYLVWALAPEVPVFMYSHVHLFSPERWQECRTVKFGRPGWQEVLDRNRVNLIVTESGLSPHLRQLLEKDSDWLLVEEGKGPQAAPTGWRGPLLVARRKKPK